MKIKQRIATVSLIWIIILTGHPANAAQSDPVLRVGISPFSPFVMISEKEPNGFSIDLWQALSRDLDIKYQFVICDGVADKLKRLQDGSIDIAIGGITINQAREIIFDFTHPVFHAGLDILIPSSEKLTFFGLISSLFEGRKLIFFAGLLFLIVIAGHLIWLVERSSKKRSTSFHKSYFPGVFEGMYWALITASTIGYGDKVPQRWIGRILAAIIIIIFLPLFGFFIAQLSSDLTIQHLKANINGPEDLWGHWVAVVEGTTSNEYMAKSHAYLMKFKSVEDTFEALMSGEVDAVVYDAPNLLYYANGRGKGKVSVVGKIFDPQDYGIALPQGSPMREELNRAILKLAGSGELENIRTDWFGK